MQGRGCYRIDPPLLSFLVLSPIRLGMYKIGQTFRHLSKKSFCMVKNKKRKNDVVVEGPGGIFP